MPSDSERIRRLLQRVQNIRSERVTLGAEVLVAVETEIDSPDGQSAVYAALARGIDHVWLWRSHTNLRTIIVRQIQRWHNAPNPGLHTYVGLWGSLLGVPELLDVRSEYVRRYERKRES